MGMKYGHGAWQSKCGWGLPVVCHLCKSQAAFLPPDIITSRVRTNHLGTQSPQAGRHSGSHSPDSAMEVREMLLALGCSTQTLSHPAEGMGSCSHGDSKGGRQLLPSWLDSFSFLHSWPVWDVNGTELMQVKHFLAFLSLCFSDKSEGFG